MSITRADENEARMVAHARSRADVLDALATSNVGLSSTEAAGRLAEYGPNKLAEAAGTPAWRRFLAQFDNVLIYILVAAGVLKAILGDWVDFAVIIAVALVNAIVGYAQEGKAEQALAGIRNMLSLHAQARRDGEWVDVEAATLVPGDVVRIGSGDRIPADMRLLESVNLQVEESALTGESVPSSKDTTHVETDADLGDRRSMVYSGTIVTAGTGIGVVTATGQGTEIGRIQSLIADVESLDTPLTRKLAQFGTQLSLIILALAAVMLLIGRLIHDFSVDELISAAIGFAVAAIPEGLPAIVTITLALGVQQMAKRRAITRKLPAVEALGAVDVICSDKTGTLTQNEMTARTVVTRVCTYDVVGTGYRPDGGIAVDGTPATREANPDLGAFVEAMAVCNDARLIEQDGDWHLVGEPTEGALRVLGAKAGFDDSAYPRIAVVPFESVNKFMVTLNSTPDGRRVVFVKGAPDRLLDRCVVQLGPDGALEQLERASWEERIDELSAQGLRVLAAASKRAGAEQTAVALDDVDDGLTFLGVVGIVDPPRPEAITAIEQCHSAGIRVKMITGDHAGTALAIAREMGIVHDPQARVLTGTELEAMSQTRLREECVDVDVYARTSPEHKIRIVSALQAHGKVVAMTGDGVNDAPALTRADIGVAMGIKGTEATKEAAGIILADDNFATIERAVQEGRRIYDNIRKSVLFLLPTNGAQSLVILVAVLIGFALPLQPVQILWVNMITAVTLSLALVFEPAEEGIMDRPPRSSTTSLVSRSDLAMLAYVSVLVAGATIAIYFVAKAERSLEVAQTAAVTMLVLGQMAYLLNCRFLNETSLRPAVLRGNRMVWLMSLLLIVLQLVFVYAPFMHTWFGSAPLTARGWGVTIALSIVVFLLVEAAKAVRNRRAAVTPPPPRP